jgi:hypothetical protein
MVLEKESVSQAVEVVMLTLVVALKVELAQDREKDKVVVETDKGKVDVFYE